MRRSKKNKERIIRTEVLTNTNNKEVCDDRLFKIVQDDSR